MTPPHGSHVAEAPTTSPSKSFASAASPATPMPDHMLSIGWTALRSSRWISPRPSASALLMERHLASAICRKSSWLKLGATTAPSLQRNQTPAMLPPNLPTAPTTARALAPATALAALRNAVPTTVPPRAPPPPLVLPPGPRLYLPPDPRLYLRHGPRL